ncbi:uncharacterized protein RCO7_02220 [Rhynchosporium graminicola]|uniref:Uncharacterized protein n=1 Tax=Rhynchosporium graminicola TaxID=2792576 RepID=A0A1E1LH52_9HELO|nr:uncharacterized protein RCO7_02220 [Rhynchosporium commune]
MSGNNNISDNSTTNEASSRARRGSFTTQAFSNIFGGTANRANSTSGPTPPFPGPITTAAAQDQRRRMSITTLGLSGTSPSQQSPFPFGARRGSVSTASSEANENAIEDDEGPGRSNPNTPFTRRMSFGAQALRTVRGGTSPGTASRAPSYTTAPLPSIPSGPRSAEALARSGSMSKNGAETPPKSQNQASTQSKPRSGSDFPLSARPGDGGGFNWSEQLRTRAESSVSQSQRPSFSTSPSAKPMPMHERAKSISEMPAPPTAVAAAPAPRPERKKPDAFQERILKGDFYSKWYLATNQFLLASASQLYPLNFPRYLLVLADSPAM